MLPIVEIKPIYGFYCVLFDFKYRSKISNTKE